MFTHHIWFWSLLRGTIVNKTYKQYTQNLRTWYIFPDFYEQYVVLFTTVLVLLYGPSYCSMSPRNIEGSFSAVRPQEKQRQTKDATRNQVPGKWCRVVERRGWFPFCWGLKIIARCPYVFTYFPKSLLFKVIHCGFQISLKRVKVELKWFLEIWNQMISWNLKSSNFMKPMIKWYFAGTFFSCDLEIS